MRLWVPFAAGYRPDEVVMSEEGTEERKKRINNFRIAAEDWKRKSRVLGGVHIALGIAAILLSAAVASKPPMFGTNPDIFSNLAYCSAAATAILTFLSAKDRAARYMAAYRTLQEMIDRYDADASYSFDHVAKAMRTATAIAAEQPIDHLPPEPGARSASG
jgi:hypothetical protein